MNPKHSDSAAGQSRRAFLQRGAMAAATALVTPSVLRAGTPGARKAPALGSVLGANDRLVIGFIGVGGQGFNSHVRNVVRYSGEYNAVAAAASDVNKVRLDRALAESSLTAKDGYAEYERLIERKDIDAIFIGTVDHWHRQVALDALSAGKHVYCEKPMTRYLMEAFDIYDAVQASGKTFQIGSQYCSEGKWHKAAELVRAGKIGKLVSGQDSYQRNNPDGEWNYEIEDTSTPENIDWEKWLGPVSDRPFSADQYHRWRKYYAYCAGILGDLLAHRIHPLLLATGNPEFPRRVACLGTRGITPDRDVPDNTALMAEMPSGLMLMVTGSTVNEQGLGQVLRGHEATLYFGGNSVELRPERPFADLVDQEAYEGLTPGPEIPEHIADYFTSIRTGKTPNGNIDLAVKTQTIISLAEMSERLGEMLYFDEKTRKVSAGSGREIEPITYGMLPLS